MAMAHDRQAGKEAMPIHMQVHRETLGGQQKIIHQILIHTTELLHSYTQTEHSYVPVVLFVYTKGH